MQMSQSTHNRNTEQELGVDITRCPPVLLEDSLEYDLSLSHGGSGKFVVGSLVDLNLLGGWGRCVLLGLGDLGGTSSFDVIKLALDCHTLGRVQPGLVPVDIGVRAWCSTNSLQHPLGRVLTLGTRRSTVADKVVDEDVGTGTDFTKVDGTSTFGEEEQSVEVFKEDGRGLVNGAEDSLAGGSELAEELKDIPGCLRVEAGGGLVKEEQKIGLGDEFNTDSQTLSLFDVETWKISEIRRT